MKLCSEELLLLYETGISAILKNIIEYTNTKMNENVVEEFLFNFERNVSSRSIDSVFYFRSLLPFSLNIIKIRVLVSMSRRWILIDFFFVHNWIHESLHHSKYFNLVQQSLNAHRIEIWCDWCLSFYCLPQFL